MCLLENQALILFHIDEKISYEDFPEVESGEYAAWYFQSGEDIQSWGYGLYNDKVNEPNIKDAYSRMFSTIESIKNRKL